MKTKIKYFVLGIVVCLLCVWICSLVKCEVLTYRHYDEFKDAYKQNTMLGNMEFFKVLEYEECGIAKVYYVSENYAAGNVLTFDWEDGEWVEVS